MRSLALCNLVAARRSNGAFCFLWRGNLGTGLSACIRTSGFCLFLFLFLCVIVYFWQGQ
uniref:Uncharacterized protein n=1 Tax=Rhizophora mucronata TaxID=61149 RepID=A0A2P2N934_RHIMU